MERIFALDSSGKSAGVCLLENGRVVYEKTLDAGRTHSETLLPLAIEAFEAGGIAPADVSLFAITHGPGSFTGLRIGMALVKGLAMPAGAPVLGVSTLQALAMGLQTQLPGDALPSDGAGSLIVPALDARRREVYWAVFCAGAAGVPPRRMLPDAAGPAADCVAQAAACAAQVVAGAARAAESRPGAAQEGTKLFFVGDGAELCYNMFQYDVKVDKTLENVPVCIARGAALLARQSLAGGTEANAMLAEEVRPVYLRLSQAERERAEKLARQ